MIPLSGTSTGSAGKASPHLQAWLDDKKAAEEKRRVLEGDTGAMIPNYYHSSTPGIDQWSRSVLTSDITADDKKSIKARMKQIFRPVGYPKEEWEGGK